MELEGVTRSSEKRSSFVPDNNPARGEWFWVDVPALAAHADLPPETPLVEVGHHQRVIIRTGHLSAGDWHAVCFYMASPDGCLHRAGSMR